MSDASGPDLDDLDPEIGSILRVYVAGSSAEMARAEDLMKRLRAAGITVTSTWPEVIKKVGEANPMGVSREQRAMWAANDLNEVASSNFFWLLIPEGKPSEGANVELGYAIMLATSAHKAQELGIRAPNFEMMCSGKERSIFTSLAGHFDTDEAAFGFVTGLNQFLLEQEASEDAEDDDEDDDDYTNYEEVVEKTATVTPFSPELTKQLDSIFKLK